MRQLDRYLLRELLLPFGFILAGFIILWTTADWALNGDDFRDAGMRAKDILLFYGLKLPEFLVFLLPLALLLALLRTLTSHARHNEITAIRSAGVSLWRLAAPYFVVGLFATATAYALNEFVVPNTGDSAINIKRSREVKKNRPDRNVVANFGFANERDRRTWQMSSYNTATAEMKDVKVLWTPPDGLQRWIYASRAEYSDDQWVFHDVREFRQPPGSNSVELTLQTNLLAMREFSETRNTFLNEVKFNSRFDSISRGKLKRAEIPIAEIIQYLHYHPNLPEKRRASIDTALFGRLATPWQSFVVVLIALPFGAASGRRNMFVGVAGSIFIVLIFHFVSEVSLALGTSGNVPAWIGGWLPNVLFGTIGAWLTARVR